MTRRYRHAAQQRLWEVRATLGDSARWLLVAAATLATGCDGGGALDDVDADAVEVAGDDGGPDADADADADGDGDVPAPWVRIVFPEDGGEAPNPVTFLWEAGGGVDTVTFVADGWPLQRDPLRADAGAYTYTFTGVNFSRHLVLIGYDTTGATVATDELDFTPTEEVCSIPDPPGFNHYTVEAINDWDLFPKDGTYPYCWEATGDTCGENWGMVHDGWYGGVMVFPGGGDCFCSGHTLEIFLRAYRLWQAENGVPETTPFRVGGRELTLDDVDIGPFYQHWQGFGVATEASAANAFAYAGIGEVLPPARWDEALPGDYANISRSTGSGHAVIFVDWIRDAGTIVGLRYYGCNSSGHSCPDPADPLDTLHNSGPSFATEYFDGHGGTVLPEYVFVGRVFLPTS
jgi:hypothetical protein